MKKLLACVCVLTLVISSGADDKEKAKPPATSPGFDALKKLVGEWNATGPDGKPMTTKFRLSAGGSVLVETMFPDSPTEMITMYHMDGGDLILTHYCMLGNQPRLKAESAKETKKLTFKSVGGTNMTMNDMHMGHAVLTLADNDHYQAEWCACAGGKPDENHKVNLKFTRKK